MFSTRKIVPVIAACLLASGTVAAQETQFIGATFGKASANLDESGRAKVWMPGVNFDRILDDSSSWGLRVGNDQTVARYYLSYDYVSDSYRSAAKVRQQTLSASYDLMLPVAQDTRLFAGATAGVTYLGQDTRGYRDDNDWGLHAGLQAGVLHGLSDNLELEGGYRYARHFDSDVTFKPRGATSRVGDARLKSSDQLYVGLNWRF
ncbi:MAG: porin family protein [Bacteroidales bacterium]|nr:porin family protein [Bacteroidales bacterium]